MRQVVLDTETTGLSPRQHRIVEIGCVELLDGKPSGNNRHWYLNPEQWISPAVVDIHGLDNDFLAEKPVFSQVANELLNFIRGAELIIHNAPFDVGFINAELARLVNKCRIDEMCIVVDTLRLARMLNPNEPNDLDSVCQRYGVDNSARTLHGALLDAELLAEVYLKMKGQLNGEEE